MDGSDEIYMQIAPEWDGRDERFGFRKVTKAEMEQFPNLKRVLIFGNERDAEVLEKYVIRWELQWNLWRVRLFRLDVRMETIGSGNYVATIIGNIAANLS